MTVAPHIVHVESPYAIRNLRAQLIERQRELALQLALSSDWPDFRQRVGVLAGLKEALDMLAEIEKRERN